MAESVLEATVGEWLKAEGDAVAAGEVVLDLETDKVNLEVTAESAGVIEKIMKHTGDVVGAGDVLGTIAEGAQPSSNGATPAAEPAGTTTGRPQAAQAAAQDGGADATPVAKRLAMAASLELSSISGTGRGGRITKEDVESAVASAALAAAEAPAGDQPPSTPSAIPVAIGGTFDTGREETRQKLSRRRLTIARRLAEVQRDSVMTTTFNEADMSAVMALRKRYRDEFAEKHGTSLGFMSFFVKAVVGGLTAHPILNSELQGDELVYKSYHDIGIAVAAEDGLVVPVVRDAGQRSFPDIEREIRELAARAKDKKLTLDELRGGTFTITNGGVFGSLMSTPILNPPQVGILGMHAIKERAIVVDGDVVARPMMYLAATYDHRVVEGADAVQFLGRVKELIEDPERLLIDA